MLWFVVFGLVALVWVVVLVLLAVWLFRRLRALFASLGRLGRRLGDGMELLGQVAENQASRGGPAGDLRHHGGRQDNQADQIGVYRRTAE